MTPYIVENKNSIFVCLSEESAQFNSKNPPKGIVFEGEKYSIFDKKLCWNLYQNVSAEQKRRFAYSGALSSLFSAYGESRATLSEFIAQLYRSKEIAKEAQSSIETSQIFFAKDEFDVARISVTQDPRLSSFNKNFKSVTVYSDSLGTNKRYWGGSCRMSSTAKKVFFQSGFAHRFFKSSDYEICKLLSLSVQEAMIRFAESIPQEPLPELGI